MDPEFNILAIILLIALLALWNLDFISALLNLKNLRPELPPEFRDTFDEDKYAKSQEYTRAGTKFEILTSLASLTVLLVFWFIGGFGGLDGAARSLGGSILAIGLTYITALAALNYLFQLPFSLYETFVLEERFGFNKTTFKTFVLDQVKTVLLMAIIGLPLVAGILWIFQNVENAWLWAWIAFTAFTLALTYLAPSVILPLFNKFEPMEDGELKQAIQRMAEKCQFPLTEISIMDGSKRSAKSNAFFTGFGKRKKIALYDNLVEQQTTEELVAVLAHEIGHFKKKHIVQRIVLSIVQTGIIFFLLGLATDPHGAFARMLFDAFGVGPISYHVGFVLFFIVFKPVSRILGIAMNAWSRKHEFEADAYAADAQETPDHLVSALKKLSADNLSNLTPHPLPVFLDYSHPPVLQRIHALRQR
ncbi:MAG: M48 family metallopeptidase [Akkermansiaceae bacterium]|nr:M48 family metallopeptidase [Akkermansiaceae bacterium]NNM29180.1 M48 family metallopeptidase [Akkermansiaceae bacterium]